MQSLLFLATLELKAVVCLVINNFVGAPHLLSRSCLFSSLVKHRIYVITPHLRVFRTVAVYHILDNQIEPTTVNYHHFELETDQVCSISFDLSSNNS